MKNDLTTLYKWVFRALEKQKTNNRFSREQLWKRDVLTAQNIWGTSRECADRIRLMRARQKAKKKEKKNVCVTRANREAKRERPAAVVWREPHSQSCLFDGAIKGLSLSLFMFICHLKVSHKTGDCTHKLSNARKSFCETKRGSSRALSAVSQESLLLYRYSYMRAFPFIIPLAGAMRRPFDENPTATDILLHHSLSTSVFTSPTILEFWREGKRYDPSRGEKKKQQHIYNDTTHAQESVLSLTCERAFLSWWCGAQHDLVIPTLLAVERCGKSV